MHQTSELYKEILKNKHRIETAVQIGSDDAVTVCQSIPGTVYGEDMIVSLTEKADLLNREAPGIGYFIGRRIELKLLNPPQRIEMMGRIVPFSRLVENETGRTSEWIPKGVFYVDTRKKSMADMDAVTVTITAYDAVLKSQADYTGDNVAWPANDAAVVADVAQVLGVSCDLSNITGAFAITKPEDKTCGEVLSGIAVLYGGNFTLDDCGILRLMPLDSSGEAEQIKCSNLKMSSPSEPIGSILMHNGKGGKYQSGGGVKLECVSPWASQNAADTALNAVSGFRYLGFQAKEAIVHPALELGDRVAVGAADGVMMSYYLDLCLYIGEIGAPEEYEINRNYPYTSSAGRGAAAATKKALKAADGVLDFSNGLVAALGAEEGAPQDLVAGLQNYVRYDLKNSELMANSALIAKIGEEARGEIRIYAVKSGNETKTLAEILADQIDLRSTIENKESGLSTKVSKADLDTRLKNYTTGTALTNALKSYLTTTAAAELYVTDDDVAGIIGTYIVTDKDGNKKSLAAILADVISLQGRIDLSGNVSVSNGQLTVLGNLVARDSLQVGKDSFYIAGNKYSPTPITSTTGTVLVLGIA